jgi:hypothetical protein
LLGLRQLSKTFPIHLGWLAGLRLLPELRCSVGARLPDNGISGCNYNSRPNRTGADKYGYQDKNRSITGCSIGAEGAVDGDQQIGLFLIVLANFDAMGLDCHESRFQGLASFFGSYLAGGDGAGDAPLISVGLGLIAFRRRHSRHDLLTAGIVASIAEGSAGAQQLSPEVNLPSEG